MLRVVECKKTISLTRAKRIQNSDVHELSTIQQESRVIGEFSPVIQLSYHHAVVAPHDSETNHSQSMLASLHLYSRPSERLGAEDVACVR